MTPTNAPSQRPGVDHAENVASGAKAGSPAPIKERVRARIEEQPALAGVLRAMLQTLRICMRYRVTGLAAELGFFAVLSFPPLVYGLLGGIGYIGGAMGGRTVDDVIRAIDASLQHVLSSQALSSVVMPTLRDALGGGHPGVISVGFLLSLWSGSRMLNVLIDTISIMYGQGGRRGIVRTRVMSLSLYLCSLVFAALVFPLIVIGPTLLGQMIPHNLQFLLAAYWPVVGGLTIFAFTWLFYIATPQRTPWLRDLPGAVFTLVAWVLISLFLREWLTASVGGVSIYGPLAATIIILVWLYFLSISVLIGAALNAATERVWPTTRAPLHVRAKTKGILEGQVARVRARSASDPYDQMDDESTGSRHARPAAARGATSLGALEEQALEVLTHEGLKTDKLGSVDASAVGSNPSSEALETASSLERAASTSGAQEKDFDAYVADDLALQVTISDDGDAANRSARAHTAERSSDDRQGTDPQASCDVGHGGVAVADEEASHGLVGERDELKGRKGATRRSA